MLTFFRLARRILRVSSVRLSKSCLPLPKDTHREDEVKSFLDAHSEKTRGKIQFKENSLDI